MKWYVLMKLTFKTEQDKKKFKKGEPCIQTDYSDTPDLGVSGTGGNPTNHFPSLKIKMHEMNKANTDPLVLYKILSTNY